MNPRAITYRKLNDIPHDLGTAVNVQAMVFGNMGDTSATGVGFTRNPSTGEKEFYGEFLQNAQGEDVVAGIRTPHPIADLEKVMPEAYQQLREITTRLERHYKDVQDFEFTIQDNTLYMLQTRNGKRTGLAAVNIAVDMVRGGAHHQAGGAAEGRAAGARPAAAPDLRPEGAGKGVEVAAKGLPASPGAATGAIVFTADEAVAWAQKGKRVLLVRMETVPDDIHGMIVAQGILTATGGMTSHAAVVGRADGQALGRGLRRAATIDAKARTLKVGGQDAQGRRPDLDRRLDRRGDPGGAADERLRGDPGGRRAAQGREVAALPEVREAARLGRRGAPARGPRQRRHPARRQGGVRASAPRASASAAPSTCSSPRTGCRTW